MLHTWKRVGFGLAVALFGAGCAAPSADGGAGGFGGTGAIAGSSGTGGFAAVGGTGGLGGGYGGASGIYGGGGTGGYLDTDAGVECPVGQQCGPTNPDDEGCGTLTLEAEIEEIITPGNLLVIFDRSGSMDSNWNGTEKYRVAGDALINALRPLQDSLTVGGVFFPSVDTSVMSCTCVLWNPAHWASGGCCVQGRANSCVVNTIDQTDQISFRPGADFIAEVPNQWRLQGASQTPLQTAVERAAQALANAVYEGPMSVVIVTDGAPNCSTNGQAVINQVTTWAGIGIRTYVIGLPGAGNAADLLNQIAMAGGTTNYIDPANAADLQTRLDAIVSSTVQGGFDSCSITLTPPAAAPDELQLVVVENGSELEAPRVFSGNGGGWSVSSDGVNVELTGAFCDNAQAGAYTELKFKFGCVSLPPLPPPVPPE